GERAQRRAPARLQPASEEPRRTAGAEHSPAASVAPVLRAAAAGRAAGVDLPAPSRKTNRRSRRDEAMKLVRSKWGVAGIVVVVAAAASALVAFGFFTSNGSGSGTATVGSPGNDLAIVATISSTLYPGHTYPVDNIRISNPEAFAQAASSISPDLVNGN